MNHYTLCGWIFTINKKYTIIERDQGDLFYKYRYVGFRLIKKTKMNKWYAIYGHWYRNTGACRESLRDKMNSSYCYIGFRLIKMLKTYD